MEESSLKLDVKLLGGIHLESRNAMRKNKIEKNLKNKSHLANRRDERRGG